jgi:hypothetical protein
MVDHHGATADAIKRLRAALRSTPAAPLEAEAIQEAMLAAAAEAYRDSRSTPAAPTHSDDVLCDHPDCAECAEADRG